MDLPPPPAPAPAPAPRMGREAAALAALSDAELRTAATRPRVIECALLELLATPAPDGAAAWTLSGANAILGVSQRTLLEHHAQHGDTWPSLGTLARCHGGARSRFSDISGGSSFASFARDLDGVAVDGKWSDAVIRPDVSDRRSCLARAGADAPPFAGSRRWRRRLLQAPGPLRPGRHHLPRPQGRHLHRPRVRRRRVLPQLAPQEPQARGARVAVAVAAARGPSRAGGARARPPR